LEILGREIRFRGRLVRTAFIDGEGYQFLQDPKLAVELFRKSKTRADLFTFIPRLSETAPKYDYPVEWDNMAALRVTSFDDWMKNQIDRKVRNMVRKSEKTGVEIREVAYDDSFVQGISKIYNESPVRQGRPFWHYGTDVEYARRINGTFPGQSIYMGTFFEGNLIGFAKLVTDESGTQAGLMQIVSMIQHRDKAPTNALIAQAVRSCADRKIPFLWYANFSYGKRQTDTLAEFKRHNGFQKIDLPRYYVPLTVLGRIALRFGLHHSLIDWIPEPVIEKYRNIRGRWYTKDSIPQQDTPDKPSSAHSKAAADSENISSAPKSA
jgi:hypothetical protein